MRFHLFRRGNIYWVRYTIDGHQFRKTLGVRDEASARRVARQLENQILLTVPETPAKKQPFDQFIDRYFLETKTRKRPQTLRVDRWAVKTLKQHEPIRFLTQKIAKMLHDYRFGNFNKHGDWTRNIKIAWDWGYDNFREVYDAVGMLRGAGFRPREISVFMLCNWRIPFRECMRKLQALAVWNVLVNDCYWDNQTWPDVRPEHWTMEELKCFRGMCRKHNQLVAFHGYDPAIAKTISTIRRMQIPVSEC